MTRPASSTGCAGALSALHHLLDVQLEQASAGVAGLQRQLAVEEGRSVEATARASEVANMARTTQARRLDVRAHSQTLAYLVELAARACVQQGEQRALEKELSSALTACNALQVRLACVQEAREHAQRSAARDRQRREVRDADLVWLGERQRRAKAAQGSGRSSE